MISLSMTFSDLWPNFKVTAFFEVEYRKKRRVLKTKLLLHNGKLYQTYGMVLCLVTLTDLQARRACCQHQLSFLFLSPHAVDIQFMNVFICLSSFAFNQPGQCNVFQLILSHNMTHKSDLPANNHLQELPWRVGSLRYLFTRLRNDLYCVEWDVKLYYTIPYHTIPYQYLFIRHFVIASPCYTQHSP